MAGIVLPKEGLGVLCGRLLNPAAADPVPWLLLLFSNDVTPDEDTVYADLIESTAAGYSRVTIGPEDWTAPVIVGLDAVSTFGTDPIQWDITGGPWNVYGWAIVTATSPVILMVERKGSPLVGIMGPNPLLLLPRFQLRTLVL